MSKIKYCCAVTHIGLVHPLLGVNKKSTERNFYYCRRTMYLWTAHLATKQF